MHRTALPTLALLLAAGPAGAAGVELVPGWESRVGWDSNVFRTPENEESDGLYQVGPTLRAEKEEGRLTFDASYRLVYEDYFGVGGVDVFDNFLRGDAQWRLGARTRLELVERFSRAHNINGTLDDGTAAPEVEVMRQRSTQNEANIALVHDLSPRWQLRASAGNSLFEFAEEDRFDASSSNAEVRLTYALTSRDVVGVGAGVIGQMFGERTFANDALLDDACGDFFLTGTPPRRGCTTSNSSAFEDAFDVSGQDSAFYQLFAVWTRRWTPTLTTSLQVGPALVEPEESDPQRVFENPVWQAGSDAFLLNFDTCPSLSDGRRVLRAQGPAGVIECLPLFPGGAVLPVDPGLLDVASFEREDAGTSVTYFANFEIAKRWSTTSARLVYSRTASTASGAGASTTLDSVRSVVAWTPSLRWRVALLGGWTRRQASSDIFIDALVVERDPALSSGVANVARSVGFVRLGEASQAFDIDQFDFGAQVTRRLSRQLRVSANGRWIQQSRAGGGAGGSGDVEFFRVFLGFSWDFDPIRL